MRATGVSSIVLLLPVRHRLRARVRVCVCCVCLYVCPVYLPIDDHHIILSIQSEHAAGVSSIVFLLSVRHRLHVLARGVFVCVVYVCLSEY